MDEQQPAMIWDWAERETNSVAARIQTELDKWPLIHFLMRHFGSLLFNASQRLIDKSAKQRETLARDQAMMLTCSRLFSECYSSYGLLRQGMILQAIVMLRSAFENHNPGSALSGASRPSGEMAGGSADSPQASS